jgi:N4-gp56 family major capsid protein
MQKAINLMGYQAAETVDREIIVVLLAGTSVSYPAAHDSRDDLSSTSTDVVNTTLVRKVVAAIRQRGAHEFDGNDFVGVVDPQVEMDISSDSTFQQAGQYSNIKILQNGEIGRWMGVRWMRSNHIPTLTGVAAVSAASATGGSLASGTYYTAVEYIDANTGFPAQVSQAASLAVGATGKIDITLPTATAYVYNVYIGASATALYKGLSLQPAASAVSLSNCLTGFFSSSSVN